MSRAGRVPDRSGAAGDGDDRGAQLFARARARERRVGGLEVGWAEHPEPRVSAGAVVEALDVLEDLAGQLAPRRPGVAVHEFLLERGEEALGDGIVVTIALAAHRAGDAGVACRLAEGQRDVLRAL